MREIKRGEEGGGGTGAARDLVVGTQINRILG